MTVRSSTGGGALNIWGRTNFRIDIETETVRDKPMVTVDHRLREFVASVFKIRKIREF